CFFFQAEDGIRDFHVTGVQTCALPIFLQCADGPRAAGAHRSAPARAPRTAVSTDGDAGDVHEAGAERGRLVSKSGEWLGCATPEIGRASCRGRGEVSRGAG